ncbi:MAG: putative Ig domain-containing protein [Verrucomicrobiales bacterium]|nr:putative Ig domain-containing protein [Verrucomicrobiales bacterium]
MTLPPIALRNTPTAPATRRMDVPSLVRAALLTASLAAGTCGALANTSYGSLNNFDVVNDTGGLCHGFSIELEDIEAPEITYTYDYNHYGTPRIIEDRSNPLHPRVTIRYEAKVGPDGKFLAFTNPQDPNHPLAPTDGHAFTDPSVNLGGEHFGVGFTRNPTTVRYHWLVADPVTPGTLIDGAAVTLSTPAFAYVPPAAGGGGAELEAHVEPPENEAPRADRYGVPVWVKVTKTVQHTGRKIHLVELVTDDPRKEGREDWAGDEEAETEIEWQLFQKRPVKKEKGEDLDSVDPLPKGDETVTRRYEFYTYTGETDPEDGEALCEDPTKCPDAVGGYIGAQMAGFNVVTPLGLIDHLQDGSLSEDYVRRSVVVGGNTPYTVSVTAGTLPPGLQMDPTTGLLDGRPAASGQFTFTVSARDADQVEIQREFVVVVPAPLTATLTGGQLKLTWTGGAGIQLESAPSPDSLLWTSIPGSLGQSEIELPLDTDAAFFRVARP